MRVAIIAIAGTVCAAWLASVSAAVPASAAPARDVENFQTVAEGCGYGWHWTGGYDRSDGAWMPGRCQPNP